MATKAAANLDWKYRVSARGSVSIETLEIAWEELRKVEPSIPVAVLTFVDVKSRSHFRGYFAWSLWKKRRGAAHEIGINPKLLGDPKELLSTMLHEAAHATLYEKDGLGGMGSTRYYHSKTFRDQCVEFGLDCQFHNTRYGFVLTSWPASGVPDRYKSIVQLLQSRLPAGTGAQLQKQIKGRDLPRSGHTLLACRCLPVYRTVYVKKSVLEIGGVVCALCGSEFKPPKQS